MAPTRTSKVKRLPPLFSESVPTSARRLRLNTTIKETRPGDRKMYDAIRPSTFKDSTPSSGSPWMNTASPILARSQSLISMWRSRPPNRSGGSLIQTVETEMHCSRSNPPAPASLRLRRSLRTTEGKALLPVIPLDIRIGGDEPQPSFVAAHIEEVPDEDQGEDSEPGPRKAIISIRRCHGRRVRFQSPPEPRPKQRLRVGNGPEAASNEMWVAVGEDRCKPCKLMEREVCKPHWNTSRPCETCVFCKGKSWSCNPPDYWLEKVDSSLYPKQEQAKTHKDDSQFKMSRSANTAEGTCDLTAPPIAQVAVVKHQIGHRRVRKVTKAALANEVEIRSNAMLGTLRDVSMELRELRDMMHNNQLMLMALCYHNGIDPLRLPGFNAAVAPPFAYPIGS